MEDGTISDGQITASSEFDSYEAAVNARLHLLATDDYAGGWRSDIDDVNQWLQIDLGSIYTRVTGVATQGQNGDDYVYWVTKYKLQYSNDEVNFQYYKEPGDVVDKVTIPAP